MSTLRVSNIEAKADASSPTIDEKVKVTSSQGRVLVQIDGKTAGITSIGINTTSTSFTIDGNQNVQFVGVITAANVNTTGVSTFTSLSVTGQSTLTNVSVSGVSTSARLNVGTGGTIITTTASGSVGIGTTNPAVALSISGTGGGSYLDIYNGGDIRLFPAGQHTGSAQNVSIYCDTSGELVVGGNFKLGGSGIIKNTSGNTILNQTGSILQVVTTNKTDVFSTTSATMTDVTGLSASITPSSTSSRILVHFSVNMGNTGQYNLAAGDITRNGTAIALGDAAGSRQRCTFGTQEGGGIHGDMRCYAGSYLDSPSSTSALTYQIRIRSEGVYTAFVNRSNEADGDTSVSQRGMSHITLMEISG
jgi:hypothetical protein